MSEQYRLKRKVTNEQPSKKTCPLCQKSVTVYAGICPGCGYDFYSKQVVTLTEKPQGEEPQASQPAASLSPYYPLLSKEEMLAPLSQRESDSQSPAKIWAIVAVGIVCALLTWFLLSGGMVRNDLQLTEEGFSSDGYMRYIVGAVYNPSGHHYRYVQVEINLYDAEGNQVGSTLDNVNNLEPEGTWRFRAMVLRNNASKYKIMRITAY
ncbi:MAG TPA: FxLYD domain-containing protein [Chthonomonadaceae bacterium]|nr:FxLYD domain-containing protein [Chthonomonadaceae bacterium]